MYNMKDVFYSSKKFLNMDGFEEDASIFTEIKFPYIDSSHVNTTLKIRDCSNRVDLTINLMTEGERDREEGEFVNSMFKIQTLIDELSKFKQACLKAHKESIRRYKKQKE